MRNFYRIKAVILSARCWLFVSCLFAALASTGCSSTSKAAVGTFASVDIQDRKPEKIRDATVHVFMDAGFSAITTFPDRMVFERPTSRSEQLTYGGWIDTTKMIIRVRARIGSLPEGRQRLQCQAYWVNSPGQPAFEEEKRMWDTQSGTYQKLLDQVVERLK